MNIIVNLFLFAAASNDYLPLNVRIPVEAGRTSDVCGRFSINGDNLLENTELLQVTVSSNDTALCPDPQLTTVTLQIIDNTGDESSCTNGMTS